SSSSMGISASSSDGESPGRLTASLVETVFCQLPGPEIHYVAMGDSYSAGEGVPKFIGKSKCHRSRRAYPKLLASQAKIPDAHFTFVACSGAQIHNLLWRTQNDELPQLDAVAVGTNLITLSIGGNDIGFSEIVVNCILRHDCV